MASRPLNDEDVLSEMNKMVDSSPSHFDSVMTLPRGVPFRLLGCVHQAGVPGESSRAQSKGR